MDTPIQNGKYIGRVVDVQATISKKGNPMIVVEWDIAGHNLRRKSYHPTANTKGVRFEYNIKILKSVFTGWDGVSNDWFVENYDVCLGVSAQLDIINSEWNGWMTTNIDHVYPLANGLPPVPKRQIAAPAKPKCVLPDEIEPTLEGVWGAFVTLHADDDYPTIESEWFALLDRAVTPQKDQDLYDEYEWRLVIEAMRESAKEVM